MTNFDMTLTQKMVLEYRKASKIEKALILNDYCKLTNESRKTVAKRFQRAQFNLNLESSNKD